MTRSANEAASTEALYVGRPNIGDRSILLARINAMLDRRWLSNDGPLVKEFEKVIAEYLNVRHCVAVCNATVALGFASRALELKQEVIVPSFTFVATAHALQWQGITPIFADIDPGTHNLDPASIERLITPQTTGIVGVHLWGRGCDAEKIEAIAAKYNLKVMYDASHGFGCSRRGSMLGGSGACEVFSFHATKFINSFEGGVITTNDDKIAEKVRLMRNFGFQDFDKVTCLGLNGKMSEVCAAMGLTSFEAINDIVAVNKRNHEAYKSNLANLPAISLMEYDHLEKNNYQYVVIEINPDISKCSRDEIVAALHAKKVMARRYFWPGCHRMEPYRTTQPDASRNLPQTERVAAQVIVLPTGQAINRNHIDSICKIIRQTVM